MKTHFSKCYTRAQYEQLLEDLAEAWFRHDPLAHERALFFITAKD